MFNVFNKLLLNRDRKLTEFCIYDDWRLTMRLAAGNVCTLLTCRYFSSSDISVIQRLQGRRDFIFKITLEKKADHTVAIYHLDIDVDYPEQATELYTLVNKLIRNNKENKE